MYVFVQLHEKMYGFEHKPCYYNWKIWFGVWFFFWVWVHITPKPVHGAGGCAGSLKLSDRADHPASLVAVLVATGPQTFLSIFVPAQRNPGIWNISITRWHMWAAVVWLAEDKPGSEVSSLSFIFFMSVAASASRMSITHPDLPYSPVKYHPVTWHGSATSLFLHFPSQGWSRIELLFCHPSWALNISPRNTI